MEVYPEGDGQPGQDFQARIENSQGQMENGTGRGSWRLGCQVEAIVIVTLWCLAVGP